MLVAARALSLDRLAPLLAFPRAGCLSVVVSHCPYGRIVVGGTSKRARRESAHLLGLGAGVPVEPLQAAECSSASERGRGAR